MPPARFGFGFTGGSGRRDEESPSPPPPPSRRRSGCRLDCDTPPALQAPWIPGREIAPLQRAIEAGPLSKIEAVLQNDPTAAATPFLEDAWKPPLVCAVEVGSDVDVVKVLLEHGANVNAENQQGLTALDVLCQQAIADAPQPPSLMNFPPPMFPCGGNTILGADVLLAPRTLLESHRPHVSFLEQELEKAQQQTLRVASVLLAAGARPPKVEWQESHVSCAKLAALCSNYYEVQACRTLLRIQRAPATSCDVSGQRGTDGGSRCLHLLPAEVTSALCSFLLPEKICVGLSAAL